MLTQHSWVENQRPTDPTEVGDSIVAMNQDIRRIGLESLPDDREELIDRSNERRHPDPNPGDLKLDRLGEAPRKLQIVAIGHDRFDRSDRAETVEHVGRTDAARVQHPLDTREQRTEAVGETRIGRGHDPEPYRPTHASSELRHDSRIHAR
jgi:hypothetical protein